MGDDANLSRREFLRGLRGRRKQGQITETRKPVPATRNTFPVHRPPGAVEESLFLDGCTQCGDCISACPHDAITLTPTHFRGAADTPMMHPMHAPCLMCEDMPCVASCEPRVLHPALPVRMAEVTIQPWACLAHRGMLCTTCFERCPVPGALTLEDHKPIVSADLCTGCGVCQYVCPAPENAVLMVPVRERPTPPRDTPPATIPRGTT